MLSFRMRPARNRARRLRVYAAIALAALASTSCAQGSSEAEQIVLRNAFEAGETRTYTMSADMRMEPVGIDGQEPVEGTFSTTMSMNVTEVRDNGDAVIEMTIGDVQVNGFDGTDVPFEAGTVTMVVAPDGSVVSVEGDNGLFSIPSLNAFGGGSPADSTSNQFFFPKFPSDAVAPGDTWEDSETVPLPFGDQSIEFKIEGRLNSFTETDFGPAARIEQKMEVPFDLDLNLGELLAGIIDGLGDAFGQGQPVPTAPPEFRDARMIMQGSMTMDANSTVLRDNGDVVQMVGDIDMDLQMRFEGLPPEAGAEIPDELGVKGTIGMEIVRTS